MNHWESANWNTLWSSLIAQALADHDIKTYFVSPGYRNAPLIAALRRRTDVDLFSCPDERAAAYQALGFARAAEKPAVLVSTSGTAGANYLPAVIEAQKEQVPLLIITTDRPFELQFTAANQTIQQQGLFQSFVKKALNFPEPGPAVKAQVVMDGVDLLCRSMATFPWGSCHINLPFRAPLEPVAVAESERESLQTYLEAARQYQNRRHSQAYQRRALSEFAWSETQREALKNSQAPLLLFGRLHDEHDITTFQELLPQIQVPYYCDVTSSLKGVCIEKELADPSVPAFRQWLKDYQPDLVLHFGNRLVTKYFDEYFAAHPPQDFWAFSYSEEWLDPAHIGAEHFQANPAQACKQALALLSTLGGKQMKTWMNWDQALATTESDETPLVSWSKIADGLVRSLQPEIPLVLGNSRAIRAFDSYHHQGFARRRIYANRGASGIEGLLATSIGLARGKDQPMCLVLGDISLIHDLNSLLALKDVEQSILVIVVNDGGGSIFRALPIAKYPEISDPLMTTPHHFHFSGIAEMAGLSYQKIRSCTDWQNFCHSLQAQFPQQSTLIEIDLTTP